MLCVITSQPSNKPASQPGTYVCQLAPPDYKFKVKCAHQSILLFPIFLIYVILSKLSPPPKRELNLSKSRTGFSVFFLCLGPIFWFSGNRLCFFCIKDPHICASWRHQTTNSMANTVTKSICDPPLSLVFAFFWYFFCIFRNCAIL